MEQYGDAQEDKNPSSARLMSITTRIIQGVKPVTVAKAMAEQFHGISIIIAAAAAAAHMGPLRGLVNTPAGRIHNNM